MVGGGAVIGQLAVVAVAPIVTRLYSAEQFGVGAVFAAMLAVAGVLACGGLDQLSLGASSPAEVWKIGCAARRNAVIAGAIAVGAGLAVFHGWGNEGVLLALLFGIAVTMTGWQRSYSVIATYRGDFASVSRQSVAGGMTLAASQVTLGLIAPSAAAFGASQAIGRSASWFSLRSLGTPHVDEVSAVVAVRARAAVVAVLGALLAAVALQLPVLAIAPLFGSAAAGQVALAQRVLGLPMTVVGAAVASVFLNRIFGEEFKGQDRAAITRSFTLGLASLSIPLGILIAVAAPAAFVTMFGSEWLEAGQLSRVWSIAITTQLIASPLSAALIPAGAGAAFSAFLVFRIVTVTGTLILSSLLGASVVGAFLALSVLLAAQNVLLIWLVWVVVVKGQLTDQPLRNR